MIGVKMNSASSPGGFKAKLNTRSSMINRKNFSVTKRQNNYKLCNLKIIVIDCCNHYFLRFKTDIEIRIISIFM